MRDVTVFCISPQWLFVAPSFTETSEFLLFEKDKNSPRSLVVVMPGSEKCLVCPFASTNNKWIVWVKSIINTKNDSTIPTEKDTPSCLNSFFLFPSKQLLVVLLQTWYVVTHYKGICQDSPAKHTAYWKVRLNEIAWKVSSMTEQNKKLKRIRNLEKLILLLVAVSASIRCPF